MIIVVRAQRCTRQCLRDYIFLPQLCFCLETERKFTDVGYDNIKKDCKIHIEVPEKFFLKKITLQRMICKRHSPHSSRRYRDDNNNSNTLLFSLLSVNKFKCFLWNLRYKTHG